jgi:hypothetical protein
MENDIKNMVTRYVYLKIEFEKTRAEWAKSAMKRIREDYRIKVGFDIEGSKAFVEVYKNKK